MNKILVYCEKNTDRLHDASFELISKAYELKVQAELLKAEKYEICAAVVSDNIIQRDVEKAYEVGANEFILIKNEIFSQYNQINYTKAFVKFFNENPADIILFPATSKGRMLAPRITTFLNTGLVADCIGLDFIIKNDELKLAATRPTFGAELMATILSKKNPQCATVRPNTFEINTVSCDIGELKEYYVDINNCVNIKLLSKEVKNSYNKDSLENANIILTAGYGLYDGNENEYIEKLQRLAQLLNASFGVSRKLVDLNAAEHKYQIGQTGLTVKPNLYIAFGVSGSIQHIMGMKNSKTIIAINNDENAEIFKYADYKIVADAREIIDELILELED